MMQAYDFDEERKAQASREAKEQRWKVVFFMIFVLIAAFLVWWARRNPSDALTYLILKDIM